MNLRRRWRAWRSRLAASLWPMPMAFAVASVVVAKGLAAVDRTAKPRERAWYLFVGGPDSARELLSTIASSMMTFTGVVFSITVLVLQLASTQYSSRVLRTFLEDRTTRLSLSVFIGSFVYPMALLPEVLGPEPERGGFVPALAVFVANVLVLVSVGVFVRYIHHMAHSIRAIHVVGRIARDTRASMEEMYPLGARSGARPVDPAAALPPASEARTVYNRDAAGVVASIDERALIELAVQHDLVVELQVRVGEFVCSGAPLLRVWGRGGDDGDLVAAVLLTEERTSHQDPAFGFRQLVDIAERALSPGLNDPTTAVQALDQLHDLLRDLSRREFPPTARTDRAGRVRLVIHRFDWPSYVHLAFDEIRQYGQSSLQVNQRLRAVVEDLLAAVPAERRPVVRRQKQLLDEGLRNGPMRGGEKELAARADSQDA